MAATGGASGAVAFLRATERHFGGGFADSERDKRGKRLRDFLFWGQRFENRDLRK